MAELNTISLINDANLVAYWRFEGNNTATVGSITGADTEMSYGAAYGKFGQGCTFNGTTSKILLTDSGNILNVASNISISMWVNGWTTGRVISNEYFTTGSDGTGWYASPKSFGVWGLESGSPDGVGMTCNTNDGNWHHTVQTFSESTNQYYGYYDGNLIESDNSSITEDLEYKANMKRVIGARYNYNGPVYDSFVNSGCYIDDLAVFKDILTPAEVRQIYDAGVGGFPFISL